MKTTAEARSSPLRTDGSASVGVRAELSSGCPHRPAHTPCIPREELVIRFCVLMNLGRSDGSISWGLVWYQPVRATSGARCQPPRSTALLGPALHGVVADRNHQLPSEWKSKLVMSTLLYACGGGGYTTAGCPRTDLIRGKNTSDAWSCSALSPSSQQKPSTAHGAGPWGQISIYHWDNSCLMLQQVYSTYLLYFFSGQMLRTSQYPPLQARCCHDAIMN